jgi:hypothetical protein
MYTVFAPYSCSLTISPLPSLSHWRIGIQHYPTPTPPQDLFSLPALKLCIRKEKEENDIFDYLR